MESRGTVILIMGPLTGGYLRTAGFAKKHGKPCLHLQLSKRDATAERLREFAAEHSIRVLQRRGEQGEQRAADLPAGNDLPDSSVVP